MKKTTLVLALILAVAPVAAETFGGVAHAPGLEGSFWTTSLAASNGNAAPALVFVNVWGFPHRLSVNIGPRQAFYTGDLVSLLGLPDGAYAVEVEAPAGVSLSLRTGTPTSIGGSLWTQLPGLVPSPHVVLALGPWIEGSRRSLYVLADEETDWLVAFLDAAGHVVADSTFQGTGVLQPYPIPNAATTVIVDAIPYAGPSGWGGSGLIRAFATIAFPISNSPAIVY